ncbi:MAG: IclR family transcriptional regulator [Coriobacteriales bacterium]|jgi:DNA-binding IclR family transcriptional regulator|nr:IclR family transcriptional regulator [Coriobacteriales bacterium]
MEQQAVKVLNKAFDILESLAYSREPLGLSAVSRSAGVSKTTTHRILGTLCERGYADKTHEGAYTIGTKMFETLSYRIDSLELQAEAKPHLIALQRSLGLSAYLGVRDGSFVSIIEKAATDRVDEQFTQVGRRYPAHCSSMGKCLMACLSSSELDDVLYSVELRGFTPHTITNKQAFREHLHQVRKQGWATDMEESDLDHRCAAAPIFDYRGDIIAVTGVSGANADLPTADIEGIVRQVVLAAQRISSCMGYTG